MSIICFLMCFENTTLPRFWSKPDTVVRLLQKNRSNRVWGWGCVHVYTCIYAYIKIDDKEWAHIITEAQSRCAVGKLETQYVFPV